jgi:hypothetical protein
MYIPFVSMVTCVHCQALPNWRGRKKEKGKLNATEKNTLKGRLRAMLSVSAIKEKFSKTYKQRRLANVHHLKALDNTLKLSLGIAGVASFQSLDGPRALKDTEKRFYVKKADLPPPLQSQADGRVRRSCIHDSSDDSTRLEIMWSAARPTLVQCLDMGSIGFNSRPSLFTNGRVRGWWEPDPPHRRHDNVMKFALEGAGLVMAKNEILMMQTTPSGPWHSSSHFQTMVEAAEEAFENMTVEDDLFVYLYPRLSFQLHEGKVRPQGPHEVHLR